MLRKGCRRDLTTAFNYVKGLQQGREQTVSVTPLESTASRLQGKTRQSQMEAEETKQGWAAGKGPGGERGGEGGISSTGGFSRLFSLGRIQKLFRCVDLETYPWRKAGGAGVLARLARLPSGSNPKFIEQPSVFSRSRDTSTALHKTAEQNQLQN